MAADPEVSVFLSGSRWLGCSPWVSVWRREATPARKRTELSGTSDRSSLLLTSFQHLFESNRTVQILTET